MMTTRTARPSTRDLSAFLAGIDEGCDLPIRQALALVTAARSEYATAQQMSYMRRLAREAIYLAVSASEGAALDARSRLDGAITYATDPTGAFRTALWPLLAALMESTARLRREARQAAARPDDSHLSPLERAYHREVRAMFAADRAA